MTPTIIAETFEDSIKDSGAHEAMKYDTVHLTSEGYDQKSLQEMQEGNRHQHCCPSTPSSPGLLLLVRTHEKCECPAFIIMWSDELLF